MDLVGASSLNSYNVTGNMVQNNSYTLAAAGGDNGEDDNYKRPTNLLFERCPFDFTDFSPSPETFNVLYVR